MFSKSPAFNLKAVLLETGLAADTAIPGVVFAGHLDGMFRAYDSANGRILWQADTTQNVKTIDEYYARLHEGKLPVQRGLLLALMMGGVQGFQLLKGYGLALVWIALWPPIYAIINYLDNYTYKNKYANAFKHTYKKERNTEISINHAVKPKIIYNKVDFIVRITNGKHCKAA